MPVGEETRRSPSPPRGPVTPVGIGVPAGRSDEERHARRSDEKKRRAVVREREGVGLVVHASGEEREHEPPRPQAVNTEPVVHAEVLLP